MHEQLWGYSVEEKLYLGVCEQKRLNSTDLDGLWVDLVGNVNFHVLFGSGIQQKLNADILLRLY
jgi:hypothetical protein